MIGDEDSPLCHDRARVTVADPCPPADLEPGSSNRFENAGFAPNAITMGPAPLRPVVGSQSSRPQQSDNQSAGPGKYAEASKIHGAVLGCQSSPGTEG